MTNMIKPFKTDAKFIRVLGSKVAVKRHIPESTSPIITPDTVGADRSKPILGEVIAIGAGRVLANGKRVKPSVKLSDVVYFFAASASEIVKDTFVIDEDAILAVEE